MKYSEFNSVFEGKADTYRMFSVFMVEPDRVEGDDVDVLVTWISELEVDRESRQIRFYSSAQRKQSCADCSIRSRADCGTAIFRFSQSRPGSSRTEPRTSPREA